MPFFSAVLTFAFSVATTACSTGTARNGVDLAGRDTIFRYVSIGPNVPVVLGLPLPPSARPHLREVAPNVFAVRPGHFSGAEEIVIRLAPDERVGAVAFTYAPDESFEAQVVSYTESLGPAVRSGAAGQRTARWQDARTRFEITERNGGLAAFLVNLAADEAHAGLEQARRPAAPGPPLSGRSGITPARWLRGPARESGSASARLAE